jgi:DNA polymerase III epsilon subunit-like protein
MSNRTYPLSKSHSLDINPLIKIETNSLSEWMDNLILTDSKDRVDKILFFDTETTDINGFMISIAMIEYSLSTDKILSETYYEVNPKATIADGASEVHGFTNESVKDIALLFKDIEQDITSKITACDFLCAYNALFDIGVLIREYARENIIPPKFYWLDPMPMLKNIVDAKSTIGRKKDAKLEEAAAFFKIPTDEGVLHNALYDTKVLLKVFQAAIK